MHAVRGRRCPTNTQPCGPDEADGPLESSNARLDQRPSLAAQLGERQGFHPRGRQLEVGSLHRKLPGRTWPLLLGKPRWLGAVARDRFFMHLESISAQLGDEPFPLNPVTLVLSAGGLVVADWAFSHFGNSAFPGGVLDETAHALTMLLVLSAIGGCADKAFAVSALVGSVLIDLDHLPRELGTSWLTSGTPRPHTHSLLTIGILLASAWVWKRRRRVLAGLALGVSIHFMRDLAESGAGVSLLWPWSNRAFTVPHNVYLSMVVLLVSMTVARLVWRQFRGERPPSLPAN